MLNNRAQIINIIFIRFFFNEWEVNWDRIIRAPHVKILEKQPFADVFQTGLLKNFTNFTGKHLCWSLFLTKLQTFRPTTLLKRDFNTGVFLRNLWKFLKHLFLQNASGACFWYYFGIINNCQYSCTFFFKELQ